MLLHWGTLEPQGSSSLASVRFSGPVRIHAIRIHPKGASLFNKNPDVVSETEPDAFSLSLFLTAQPTPTVQDPRPKGNNILVPTKLSYAGGCREFPLDMGSDFVTRLMMVQGTFRRVTLAVYGDVVSHPATVQDAYDPIPLPEINSLRLPTPLDLFNTADPSLLARELLALNSDAPSLSLVIRLTCCLTEGDTDSSTFRHSNMEELIEADLSGLDWLAKATDTLLAPISHHVDSAILKKFADKVSEFTSAETKDTLYVASGLLRCASAQPVSVLLAMLDTLDMNILVINSLDTYTLERLQDAAANPVMARALRTGSVLDTLHSLGGADWTSQPLKYAATNLLQRVFGWERFEKALTVPVPDTAAVARWIKEITSGDMTFGVFVLSMIEDESLISKLAGHPLQEQASAPVAFWTSAGLASLPEFLAFMRAFVGIACVMVVLCWSVRVSDTHCSERIFAMIRLWQEVDGYREIVNHLLLVPHLTYHLQSFLKDGASSIPNTTVTHVEQILSCLLAQPETMTRPELFGLVNALTSEPASISVDERQEMVEISTISDRGLPGAVDTVLRWCDHPVDASGARALQTALLILETTLEDRETGEWRVTQAAWQKGSHGLVYHLVEIFHQSVRRIRGQFLLTPPLPLPLYTLLRLLVSSNATLRILARLLPAHPLPSHLVRELTHNIASLFIATDAVDSRYSHGSAVCQVARATRPTCAEAIAVMSSLPDQLQEGGVGGELVLRTLLHTALYPEGDDPVARLEQVFWLLDLVLPLSLSDTSGDRTARRFWTRNVIPSVLPELQRFMGALAVDHKVQLVKRLGELDRDEVALRQWFVDEELKYLISDVEGLKMPQLDLDRHSMVQTRISNSIQFLSGLLGAASPGDSLEYFRAAQTLWDISRVLACLLDNATAIASVLDFACLLAPHATFMGTPVQFELILTLLRGAGSRPPVLLQAATILPHTQPPDIGEMVITRAASELGPTLQRASEGDEWQSYWRQEEEPVAQAIVLFLSWIASNSKTDTCLLPGISEVAFTKVLERIAAAAPTKAEIITHFRAIFTFSDDVVMRAVVEGPATLSFSGDRLGELFTTPPLTPSTPRLGGESIFKMATISPITALVGTSKISTLTKTYQNNDFRQLSVRQNTSRRPSMHVDDFEQGRVGLASPIAALSSPPVPAMAADYSQGLPPEKLESE